MLFILKRFVAALMLSCLATVAVAQSEYKLRRGDVIAVEVLEDASLNRSVVVLPDGRFSFPFAGSLPAAGRTVSQIKSSITSAIAPNFAATPTVFVSVNPKEREPLSEIEADTIDVYFLGEVNTPGLRQVEPGTTLLQAMSQSGGLTRFAATKRIQLRRTGKSGQPQIINFNYKAVSNGASLDTDPKLRDGDVIVVPERRLFE
ncbi:MAG: polysaccharide biosynthesis/export family protein [Pseudomonadota bacterium]